MPDHGIGMTARGAFVSYSCLILSRTKVCHQTTSRYPASNDAILSRGNSASTSCRCVFDTTIITGGRADLQHGNKIFPRSLSSSLPFRRCSSRAAVCPADELPQARHAIASSAPAVVRQQWAADWDRNENGETVQLR